VPDWPRVHPSVRSGARPTPGIRIGGSPVDAPLRIHRRRMPGTAARGFAREAPGTDDRVEPPAHRSGLRVQGEERAPAAGGLTGRARVDEAVGDERRDRDRVPRPRQPGPPSLDSRARGEREGAGVGVAVHDPVRHRDTVRPTVRAPVPVVPEQVPVGEREGVDVAVQVLDVHPAVRDDRRRGIDAGEPGLPAKPETPTNPKPVAVGGRRRAGYGTCARVVCVRLGPVDAAGRLRLPGAAAAGERKEAERRDECRYADATYHRLCDAYSPSPENTAMLPRMTRGSQLRAQR
jgi:hypothetical protein